MQKKYTTGKKSTIEVDFCALGKGASCTGARRHRDRDSMPASAPLDVAVTPSALPVPLCPLRRSAVPVRAGRCACLLHDRMPVMGIGKKMNREETDWQGLPILFPFFRGNLFVFLLPIRFLLNLDRSIPPQIDDRAALS